MKAVTLLVILPAVFMLSPTSRNQCTWEKDQWAKYLERVDIDTVTRLNRDFNCLDSIPMEVFAMKNLEQLNIDVFIEGKLLQKEVRRLKKLKRLLLGKSKITQLPNEIGQLENLEELYVLGGRELTSVPKEIGSCTKLKKMSFFRNKLTTSPDEIVHLKSLKSLDLRENNFSQTERERIKQLLPNCKIVFDY